MAKNGGDRPQHAAHVRRRPGRDDRPANPPASPGHRRHQPRRLDQLRRGQGQALRHHQPARRRRRASASRSTSAASRTSTATAIPTSTRSSTRSSWTRTASASPSPATSSSRAWPATRSRCRCFGCGHLYMPFRPPVADHAPGVHGHAVRHPLRPAGPSTRRRCTSPNGDGLALVSNAGCLAVRHARPARTAARVPRRPDRHQPGRPRPRRLLRGDHRGRPRHGRVVSAQPPRPGRGRDRRRGRGTGEKLFQADRLRRVPRPRLAPVRRTTRPPRTTPQRFDGDRRFFDLKVAWNDKTERLEGKVVMPGRQEGRHAGSRGGGRTRVRGIYSDFKYHDVGEDFYQMQFDGSVIKKWRTAAALGRRHAPPPTATTAPASTSTASSAATAARRWSRGRATPP